MAELEVRDAGAPARPPVEALRPGVAVAALAAVAGYSLIALTAADDSLGGRAGRFGLANRMPWRLAMASLLVALVVYLLADGGAAWRRPAPGTGRHVLWFSVAWLAGVAIGTFGTGVGTTTWHGPVATLRGVVVVPLIEELVFRGALFALASRVAADRWPGRRAAWLFPLVLTAALFWIGHLQYVMFDAPRWIELRGYTIFGGLAFGWLRHRTGSMWPALAVHVAGNGIALVAGSV